MKDKMKLGEGGRFKKLKAKLSKQKGIYNPEALSAKIGMKKYRQKKMSDLAQKGKK